MSVLNPDIMQKSEKAALACLLIVALTAIVYFLITLNFSR